VLPSEAIDAPAVRTVFASTATRQFPLYVDPAPDEALVSWLLRLATRLGISMRALAHEAFVIDDRSGRSQWWRRPHPSLLERISHITGVSTLRLRRMTMETWAPVYRDDEASERFSQRCFTTIAPQWRAFRFAVCAQCLKADVTPYLRLSWTIGWLAVCPRHGTILTARCDRCRGKLRTPRYSWAVPFSPQNCTRCEDELWFVDLPADPAVIRLQDALLRGKREGFIELEGIGRLSWMEMVALTDVLIGMFWTDQTFEEQQRVIWQFRQDFNVHWSEPPSVRYADLALLAWLTQGWPHSRGVKVAQDILSQWLGGEPHVFRHLGAQWTDPYPEAREIERKIRARFQELLDASRPIPTAVPSP